jgi:hypothetical protein
MAVVDRTSTGIANAIASPRVPNNVAKGEGMLREVFASIVTVATDSATSVGRFFRIASNARLSSLKITHTEATTTGQIDIGLHDIDGGAVVDVDFFQDAYDVDSGADIVEGELIGNSTAGTPIAVANLDEMIWEMLGLSEDPVKEYDVTYTIVEDFSGGPTLISLRMQYVR